MAWKDLQTSAFLLEAIFWRFTSEISLLVNKAGVVLDGFVTTYIQGTNTVVQLQSDDGNNHANFNFC